MICHSTKKPNPPVTLLLKTLFSLQASFSFHNNLFSLFFISAFFFLLILFFILLFFLPQNTFSLYCLISSIPFFDKPLYSFLLFFSTIFSPSFFSHSCFPLPSYSNFFLSIPSEHFLFLLFLLIPLLLSQTYIFSFMFFHLFFNHIFLYFYSFKTFFSFSFLLSHFLLPLLHIISPIHISIFHLILLPSLRRLIFLFFYFPFFFHFPPLLSQTFIFSFSFSLSFPTISLSPLCLTKRADLEQSQKPKYRDSTVFCWPSSKEF